MRKATWFAVSREDGSGGFAPNFADSKPRDGETRRESPQEGAEAEKALFKCRDADFKQHVSYLRKLVDKAEFSDKNRERMLKALDLFDEAKQTMASIIEDEVRDVP